MTLRAIQEFVVHFESFRNVDLWYQGAYLLRIQIFFEGKQANEAQIYAHPFAHTQNYFPGEEERIAYDSQIIKPAFMHTNSSSFLSKAFLLRYYEQEVQINDICHFRVETDLSTSQQQFTMQISLLFYDQQIKKVDPQEITVEKGKVAKTKRYCIRNTKAGVHECVRVVFEGQYYSVANLAVHSTCIDYRFRQCPLQLFQFSRMSNAEKRKLLDRNKKMQNRSINLMQSITAQLKLANNLESLQIVEDLVLKEIKKTYHSLLKEYSTLFSRVITEQHRQAFANLLVNPSQLGLFQEESSFYRGSTWLQRLYKRYKSNIGQQIIQRILDEANLVSGQLLKLWHHYIDLIKISPRFTIAYYQEILNQQQTTFWSRLLKNYTQLTSDICLSTHKTSIEELSQKQLIQVRNKLTPDHNVLSEQWITKKSTFPLITQMTYHSANSKDFKRILPSQEVSQILSSSQARSEYRQAPLDNSVSLHLIVLVHGFQGNSLDMKLIKNNFSVVYPEASFLCATSNEELTDNDIIEMGARLATEIKNHVIEFFPPDTLRHISFVGHSLGGVIIRAALPRLLDLRNKFHSLITLASPHLGYKVNTSSVIEAGIWVLLKLKSNNCLKQLTMADNTNIRESCLYRLSKFEGIKYFQHVFLFSSKQDSYAPFESARIQIDPNFMDAKDPLKEIHCQMVRNILADVQPEALHRLEVNFTIEQTNLDSLIGRTAHILFLESSELMQIFLHTRPFLFS